MLLNTNTRYFPACRTSYFRNYARRIVEIILQRSDTIGGRSHGISSRARVARNGPKKDPPASRSEPKKNPKHDRGTVVREAGGLINEEVISLPRH